MQNLVQKRKKKVNVPQTNLYTGLAICAYSNFVVFLLSLKGVLSIQSINGLSHLFRVAAIKLT